MALHVFRHRQSGEIKKTLKKLDPTEWEELIIAPNQKFMVSANKATGKSKLKDANKILTERARNHSRDHDLDDNIQVNIANGLESNVQRSFLNSKKERRRKIDDI